MDDALVVGLEGDARGVEGVGADVGDVVEPGSLELAPQRGDLVAERGREEGLVVLEDLEDLLEDVGVVARVGARLGEHEGPGDALVEGPLGRGRGLAPIVEGHQERVVLDVGERGLGRGGHEDRHLASGGLQDGQGEVGEGRADEEVGPPVEQLLGSHTGSGGVATDVLDPDLDGRAVDAADAVDQVGEVGHQLGAGDVDEADHVAEVHGHADPDRIAGGGGPAVGEVGVEGGPDVDSLDHRLRPRHGRLSSSRLGGGLSLSSLRSSSRGLSLSLSRFQLGLELGHDVGVDGSLSLFHGGLQCSLGLRGSCRGSLSLSSRFLSRSLSLSSLSLSSRGSSCGLSLSSRSRRLSLSSGGSRLSSRGFCCAGIGGCWFVVAATGGEQGQDRDEGDH